MKVTLAAVFLAFAPAASPLMREFSPFPGGAEPRLHRVVELRHTDSWDFAEPNSSRPVLRLFREPQEPGFSLVLYDRSGKPLTTPMKVSSLWIPNRAYVADINHDKRPDYIVEVFSGGTGIPPTDVVFAVSSGSQYEITVFRSFAPSKDDFVDLMSDGRFQYIQSIFVLGDGVEGKDGRRHNYWVYNIYALEGATFTQRNEMKPDFPKWVMYAGRVNHRPTEQLNEEQKRQLWIRRSSCLVWSAGDPCTGR